MQTEVRLKQILDEAKLDTHGRIQRIAGEAQINRHTVRKLYNNETAVFSLETISKICAWLERYHLAEGLPGRLFAARPSELLEAIFDSGIVTLYVGVSKDPGESRHARGFVARDDSEVASRLVHLLSSPPPPKKRAAATEESGHADQTEEPEAPKQDEERQEEGKKDAEDKEKDKEAEERRTPGLSYVFVPSRSATAAQRERNRDAADVAFATMRGERSRETPVIIGSQRANYLCELFVTQLFLTDPWAGQPGEVPIYLKYHDPDDQPSSFGGFDPPPWDRRRDKPGIYYRHHDQRKWSFVESKPREQGTGVILLRRDPGMGRLELAVFGLSGLATAVMGKLLCEMPGRFWPTGGVQAGLEIGLFVCSFSLDDVTSDDQEVDTIAIGPPEIVEVRVNVPGKKRKRS